MSDDTTNKPTDYERRIHSEMLDSFDEEFEMEIDDERMDALISEAMASEGGSVDMNNLDVPAVMRSGRRST